jgi:hypothetical protein
MAGEERRDWGLCRYHLMRKAKRSIALKGDMDDFALSPCIPFVRRLPSIPRLRGTSSQRWHKYCFDQSYPVFHHISILLPILIQELTVLTHISTSWFTQ